MCLCIDCQSYAHYLGRAEELLDENGGTDIFQLAPGQLEFQQGTEQLRCVRLGPEGAMRWYTDCCKTPVGNTAPSAHVPIVGVPHLLMVHGASPGDRDRDLGPVRFRVQGQYGHRQLPPGTHPEFPTRLLLRTVVLALRARVHGLARPNPFWDERGEPRVKPLVLAKDERERLRELARRPPARA